MFLQINALNEIILRTRVVCDGAVSGVVTAGPAAQPATGPRNSYGDGLLRRRVVKGPLYRCWNRNSSRRRC